MVSSGTGVYFDGRTSRRQDVHVAFDEAALTLLQPDGRTLERWPLASLREIAAPVGVARIASERAHSLARLELRDPALTAALRAAAPSLGASRRAEAGSTRKVVFWSLAAVVSLTLFGLYGVPALADKVTPLLPWSVDVRMGDVADRQVRYLLPTGDRDFECGGGEGEAHGRAALDALGAKLGAAAALPVPLRIVTVRSDIPNALALPGGYVYLFQGLIDAAETPDEIAAVLAHEIGHVAHRDGTRRTLQAGGVSLLFGFVLGDFTGGTAAVFIARLLTEASYSREAETSADVYAVKLMRTLGGDARGLGTLLNRISKRFGADDPSSFDYLSSHPHTGERSRAIDAAAGSGPTTPLLDPAQFRALKTICGPAGGAPPSE